MTEIVLEAIRIILSVGWVIGILMAIFGLAKYVRYRQKSISRAMEGRELMIKGAIAAILMPLFDIYALILSRT